MNALQNKQLDIRLYVAHWFVFVAVIMVGMFLFSVAHDILVDQGGMLAAYRRQLVNGLIISALAGVFWDIVLFFFVRQKS